MPKPTFYNLPEDKKLTLIDAAKKEFSRVPLSKASISNIVKTAGIPRGSFYQYFEDKEDAYFFLLNDFVHTINSCFKSLLKKHDGKLFHTMIELFQLIIEEEDNFYFLKNSFLNMNHKIEDQFSGIFSKHNSQHDNFREITSLINIKELNVSDENELYHLMQIISAVTFRNFIEKFAKELSNQEALRNYKIEINLMKKGLSRETTT